MRDKPFKLILIFLAITFLWQQTLFAYLDILRPLPVSERGEDLQYLPTGDEKISSIPKDSHRIEVDGKAIYISPKAANNMKKLDDYVRGLGKNPAEIVGFGLTKAFDYKTAVLVDFIPPRRDKILILEDLPIDIGLPFGEDLGYLSNIGGKLMETVADSEQLTLTQEDDMLVLKSDKKDSTLDLENILANLGTEREKTKTWDFIYKFLKKLYVQTLPSDLAQIKDKITTDGSIALTLDWDCIVAFNQAYQTVAYMKRIFAEAKRQKALPDFSMHHHPNLGLRLSMKELIQPSYGDLLWARRWHCNWFEIRTLGSESNRDSKTEFTNQVYNMENIYSIQGQVQSIIREIEDLNPDVSPEVLYGYVIKLLSYIEKLSVLNYNTGNVMTFILGAAKIKKYREELEDWADVKSIKDMILRAIIHRFDPVRALKQITLEALAMHVRFNTHFYYQAVMDVRRADPRFSERINDLGEEKPLFWHLSSETDPKKIAEGFKICMELYRSLPLPPSGRPGAEVIPGHMTMAAEIVTAGQI